MPRRRTRTRGRRDTPRRDAGELLDPYEVLGVERGSREDVITTVYRRLARQYHPDRYAASQTAMMAIAQQRMADINIAYAILTDPEAARRHRHSEMRRDAAVAKRQAAVDHGTVFATSAHTAAPPAGQAPRPAGAKPAPPGSTDPDFDYRRDASAEFEVDDDAPPPTTEPGSQPWTSTKPGRGGIFRRK